MSAPSQLHLFYTLTERAAAPDQLRRYRELLCPDERARADGFVFAHDRDAFEIAHALVRCALSRFAEVRPEAWRFDFNPHGRPRVAAPAAPDLDFNLSHARGIAACVIGQGVLVGVDVENTERPAPLESVAGLFGPAEVAALELLPAGEQPRRFFELWTLKEAYLKARGLALALPLDDFTFDLEGEPRIEFAPGIEEDPRRWRFRLLRPTTRHQVAVACLGAQDTGIELFVRELIPLGED